jgi:CDP-diacylglycerol--inositol 3-phosphatidyltransferase
MTTDEPYLLRLYYTSKPILFTMCAGNELFYITMYLINFYDSCKLDNLLHVKRNQKRNRGIITFTFFFILVFWKLLAFVCFPIAVAKWLMAILQGVTAAKNLALIDLSERQAGEKIQ